MLAASGDTFDDRAGDSVPAAQRGPLVAVVRVARAIAVSGLKELVQIEEDGAQSYSAHMPDYGRALFAQGNAALEVFKRSFVVGGAVKDAPPGALVIAASGRLKGLAPKMSPATLTALADAMILEILMAHGELFVGRPR
ncbi:hypothetical protein [Nannocystis pusilla]|uniref:hypothetical protein n=1 Tax=Nannocystis pusilla TaxID=889268 RepID=UPI003B7655C9